MTRIDPFRALGCLLLTLSAAVVLSALLLAVWVWVVGLGLREVGA